MGSNFKDLPPSKRFKLLRRQDPPLEPHVACLPAKKRIECLRIREEDNQFQTPSSLSYCLPTKKRILSPNPFLPFEFEISPKKTKLSPVPEESSDLKKPETANQKNEVEEEEEDGVICAVCSNTDGNTQDPIVCDGCDLMVHASCYGNPQIDGIPEGDWFCKRSEIKREKTDCCLCTSKVGPTKPTTDGRWAHILCALHVPEVLP